ncbi:hypothetical protein [Amycolatopsis sp. cmx-4-68]|uniref:hypothetical protein n=1 Tax=Amycolatopsis sp. cmx-4-68 TaxID=2790938 RepID=UPI00397B6180
MDDLRTTYEALLRELRKGAGCTIQKLSEDKYSELVLALRSRLLQTGKPISLESCRNELQAIAKSLEERRIRESFLAALRLDSRYQADTLLGRRSAYLSSIEHAADAESRKLRADIRTLERRENKGIEMVARALMDDHVSDANIGSLAPTSSDQVDLHLTRKSHTHFYSETGSVIRSEHRAWTQAISENANPRFPIYYQLFSENRRGLVDIQPLYGCKLVSLEETSSGTVKAILEIFKTLTPEDGPYPIAWNINFRSENRAASHVRWTVKPSLATSSEFHLVFHEACVPVRAWWFSEPSDIRAQIEPSEEEGRHLPLLDGGRYIYKVFDAKKYDTLTYLGIAYAWE